MHLWSKSKECLRLHIIVARAEGEVNILSCKKLLLIHEFYEFVCFFMVFLRESNIFNSSCHNSMNYK